MSERPFLFLYDELREFEEGIKPLEINGQEFFELYYNKLFKEDENGCLIARLASIIETIIHEEDGNNKLTLWINFFSKLDKNELSEISDTKSKDGKERIIDGRFTNLYASDAYVGKNHDNDYSSYLFYTLIQYPEKKESFNPFTVHKYFKESKNFINKLQVDASSRGLEWYVNGKRMQSFNDLNEESDSLTYKIDEEQFEYYNYYLSKVFGSDDVEYSPKYPDGVNNNIIDSKILKLEQLHIIHPKYFYVWNLSIPKSPFFSGTLMIFCNGKISDAFEKNLIYIREVFNALCQIEHRYLLERKLFLLKKAQLKTAIISILIDSYAHNISAHSLAALKWWVEQRYRMLAKRFKAKSGINLRDFYPGRIVINKSSKRSPNQVIVKSLAETSLKYYKALGQGDLSSETPYSLFDFLQFADNKIISKLFSYLQHDNIDFVPRFPVPIDYAIYPFLRFLRDKGAFWSGVTRDEAFGGESKTWFEILWEDFANNPLYLGTIAHTENVSKINIYLAVKSKDQKWHTGSFVTLDMSIMEYETNISQSKNLESDENNITNNLHYIDKCENKEVLIDNPEGYYCKLNTNFVESNNYSKYAFVKLGKCFVHFREILNDENQAKVYLPGGIVGEHALFTLFENTLRNIKHYNISEAMKSSGVNFWISIEESKLKEDSTDNDLYKVGVWIQHEMKLFDNNNIPIVEKSIEHTFKSIIDDNGFARLGGNSQDKACAAMLFNNKFNKVEDNKTDKDKKYYPWLWFGTSSAGNPLLDHNLGINSSDDDKIKRDKYAKYSASLIVNNNGYLKKYFYLWKASDVVIRKTIEDNDWENPSRTRFLLSEGDLNQEFVIKARRNGIIRIIKKEDNDSLTTVYLRWLNLWLNKSTNYSIRFQNIGDNGEPQSLGDLSFNDGNGLHYSKCSANNPTKTLKFSHGKEKEYTCNVRRHGTFFSKYFSDLPNKDLDQFENYKTYDLSDSDKSFKAEISNYEFAETVLSKVVIFDNRVFNRFPSHYHQKDKKDNISKMDMFQKDLSLIVRKEDVGEFKDWISTKNNDVNILVMHLSFIESMVDSSGNKYTEERINDFIKFEIKSVYELNSEEKVRSNFIFVITSGRGRDVWRTTLKKDSNRYDTFTIYKPIESILSAIESGISYNDHFEVKHNLIKVLFGN